MPVITVDRVLKGCPRDRVLEWLADTNHHKQILEPAFQSVERTAAGEYSLTLAIPPRKLLLGYSFLQTDTSHGGRRVRIQMTGRRTQGEMCYSLRTVKPANCTLVTLKMDYKSGRILGPILDNLQTRNALESAMSDVLAALDACIPRLDTVTNSSP